MQIWAEQHLKQQVTSENLKKANNMGEIQKNVDIDYLNPVILY